MVGATGFEPATSRTRTVRSTRLSHAPTLGPVEPGPQTKNLTHDGCDVNDGRKARSSRGGEPAHPGREETVGVVAVGQGDEIASVGHGAAGFRQVGGGVLDGEVGVAFDKGFHDLSFSTRASVQVAYTRTPPGRTRGAA